MSLAILSATLILSACSSNQTEPQKPIIQTVTVKQKIPVQSRPDAVNLRDIKFYVVTEENFEEFKTKFIASGNEFVFVAISIDDYEDLSLNIAELKRYIEQQGSLIVYYENALD